MNSQGERVSRPMTGPESLSKVQVFHARPLAIRDPKEACLPPPPTRWCHCARLRGPRARLRHGIAGIATARRAPSAMPRPPRARGGGHLARIHPPLARPQSIARLSTGTLVYLKKIRRTAGLGWRHDGTAASPTPTPTPTPVQRPQA
jgi:hypothetical protein